MQLPHGFVKILWNPVQRPHGFVKILWDPGFQKSCAPAISGQEPTTRPHCMTRVKHTSFFSTDLPNRFLGQASRKKQQDENLGLKTPLLSSSSLYIKCRYLIQI